MDPYIIDIIRRKEDDEKRQRERPRIPLHIYPPDFDGYKDEASKKDKTNRGYIEIDIHGDPEDDSNVIKM